MAADPIFRDGDHIVVTNWWPRIRAALLAAEDIVKFHDSGMPDYRGMTMAEKCERFRVAFHGTTKG